MPDRIEIFIRRLQSKLTRSRVSIKLFGLRKSEHVPKNKGLIIVQIDALSKKQLENALEAGRVPFIKSLLTKEFYRLHTLYSGMPCSTAAVQAELLYGVKSAVPAFSFYDYNTKRVFIMFNPTDAREIEQRLRYKGQPLLTSGTAYSDIYTGGAEESHYCIANLRIRKILRFTHIFGFTVMALMHFYSLARTLVLFVVEIFLALSDLLRGLSRGKDLGKELKFIPSRVAMCVLLREFIVIESKIDIARGMPIIHMNFMGYHEQSHRRGGTSRFAHWTLRGIDNAIKRVWVAAHKSSLREYDVWIYSDHGQIDTISYNKKYDKTIQQAVQETFEEIRFSHAKNPNQKKIGFLARTGLRKSKFFAGLFPSHPLPDDNNPVITSLGPTGHIYLRNSIESRDIDEFALDLIKHTHVPMVFIANKNHPEKKVEVWTEDGHFILPDQADQVFDTSSVFYKEMVEDFIYSCKQQNCGDLIMCGWDKKTGKCLTFAVENGSHGGITTEEAEAFTILPTQTSLNELGKGYFRPLDLRKAAFQTVARYSSHAARTYKSRVTGHDRWNRNGIRVMTYNVHGCVGMDGKLSPRRVADCIAQYEPDIVALQELDVGRERSGKEDQAMVIAEYLNMEHHFHAAMRFSEEEFGEAILSAFPIALVKKQGLSRYRNFSHLEPRGILWAQVEPVLEKTEDEYKDSVIQVLNTHLGLNSKERLLHAHELLGKEWIGSPHCAGPVILCGDFNAMPSSKLYKLIQKTLTSVQINSKHRHTWFGRYPLATIDHIFVSSHFEIINVEVGDSYLARLASDHRPIFADLKIKFPSIKS